MLLARANCFSVVVINEGRSSRNEAIERDCFRARPPWFLRNEKYDSKAQSQAMSSAIQKDLLSNPWRSWTAAICLHKATLGRSSSELVQESGPTEGQITVLRKRFNIQLASTSLQTGLKARGNFRTGGSKANGDIHELVAQNKHTTTGYNLLPSKGEINGVRGSSCSLQSTPHGIP